MNETPPAVPPTTPPTHTPSWVQFIWVFCVPGVLIVFGLQGLFAIASLLGVFGGSDQQLHTFSLVYVVVAFVVQYFILRFGYRWFTRVEGWQSLAVAALVHTLLAAPMLFLGLNAVGGTSMALSEGAAQGSYWSRFPIYLMGTVGALFNIFWGALVWAVIATALTGPKKAKTAPSESK